MVTSQAVPTPITATIAPTPRRRSTVVRIACGSTLAMRFGQTSPEPRAAK